MNLSAFVKFREEVITRRAIYELGKARDKAHVLAGLGVALPILTRLLRLFARPRSADAREGLIQTLACLDVAPMID